MLAFWFVLGKLANKMYFPLLPPPPRPLVRRIDVNYNIPLLYIIPIGNVQDINLCVVSAYVTCSNRETKTLTLEL